jgi:hypothetical protein
MSNIVGASGAASDSYTRVDAKKDFSLRSK